MNSTVRFGSRTFPCKHVSIIYNDGNTEVYVPVVDTPRLFVASHSTPCAKCNNKRCINRINNGSIQLYDSFTDSVIMTPSKPYDMHNAYCAVYDKAITGVYQLGNALMRYNAAKEVQTVSEQKSQHKRSSNSMPVTRENSVRVAVCDTSNPNEVIVPVNKFTSVHEYKGGTHASPVAHSVSGYWRRKSRNDSTMIFVKSFARGGSKADREKINIGIQKKQTVYKVEVSKNEEK